MSGRVVVGVDFDNTLVCYDRLFHALASQRGLLAGTVAADKRSVRDHLRAAGREDAWTALQAVAYGERIGDAEPFAGARAFFTGCADSGVEVYVVSHKTRTPYAGGGRDLRDAARGWLEARRFFDTRGALTPERVYFEASVEEKVARIGRLGCTHFIDDLAEFLAEPALPRDLVRILFDPNAGGAMARPGDAGHGNAPCLAVRSWKEVAALILEHA